VSLPLLLLFSTAFAAEVNLATDTLLSLNPPEVTKQDAPVPWISDREVHITPTPGGLMIHSIWQLDSVEPGWRSILAISPGAHVQQLTWRGRDLDGVARPEGLRVTLRIDGPGELIMTAFVPGDPAETPIVLAMEPAPIGTVTTDGLELADAVEIDGTWWTGQQRLTLQPPATVRRHAGTLVVAHGGMGLTVQEDVVLGRARMVWEIRQGQLDRVSFTLKGAGQDLDVTGVGLREWQRSGDRVTAILQGPSKGRVVLQARWTTPVPNSTESTIPVPILKLEGAFRADVSLQLSRDGEIEVLPELRRWDPIPRAELPEWGRDLVEGTPTAAYVASSSRAGKLQLLRYVPVASPAMVVDVAAHTAAVSVEGRILARSLFQVRNERASHLRVVLPTGARLVGLRVGPRITTPVSDDAGGILVPLQRSVETVQGMISFPVEVVWFLETEPWTRASSRTLPLPVLDAPIGVQRTTVYLPPTFRDAGEIGERGRVASFSEGEGITYGFASGDVLAVMADLLFQDAVTSWLDNDFDGAQENLAVLRELGADNDDMERLQSNLDLLFADPEPQAEKADKTAERRIKAQARARSSGKARKQKEVVDEAEEAERKGDYAQAEELYIEALKYGQELAALEEDESVEQSAFNLLLTENLLLLDTKKSSREEANSDWWETDIQTEVSGFLDFEVSEENFFDLEYDGSFLLGGQLLGDQDDNGRISGEVGLGSTGSGVGGGGSVSMIRQGHAYGGSAAGMAAPPSQDDRSPLFAALITEDRPGRLGRRSRSRYYHETGALPAPRVTASVLSVTIPAAGQAVYYQRMLLPAGAASEVVLEAEPTRLSRRSR
jgi:hypothetical protein